MEDRRKPPTGLDRTGPRFVRHAAIGLKADSARIGHFVSERHEPDQRAGLQVFKARLLPLGDAASRPSSGERNKIVLTHSLQDQKYG
jgi:hypothetical protein